MRQILLFLVLATRTVSAAVTNDVAFTAAHDGSEQHYVELLPDGFDAAQAHDLLICLHGHGSDRWQFVRDARDEVRAARDAAAESGLIFVSPDYRGKASWMGPAAEADLLQVIGEIKKKYKVARVILSGGSMGASGALTFAALHPSLADGVVAFNGLADHVAYTNFQDAVAAAFGGTKSQVPDEYRKRSAVYFHDRFVMPLAVTTGGKDTLVPPDSVLRLTRAAQARNPFVHIDHRPARGHETEYAAALAAYRFVLRAPACRPVCSSVTLNGAPLLPAHATAAGVWFYAADAQVLLTGHGAVPGGWRLTASLNKGDELRLKLDPGALPPKDVHFESKPLSGVAPVCATEGLDLVLRAAEKGAVRLSKLTADGQPVTLIPQRQPFSRQPVACSPDPHPEIAEAMIEWDWRMQDGIGTPRRPRMYAQAVEGLLPKLDKAGLGAGTVDKLRARRPDAAAGEDAWEAYWLAVHQARRSRMLAAPQFAGTPLLFAKYVPSVMSHQLTQVYGYCARPGGGLFVLERTGASMRTRNITPATLPPGSFMTPELSFDARRVLFAYCPVAEAPAAWAFDDRTKALRYHLQALSLTDGSVQTLTQGETDNFCPVMLPSGDVLFSSTRRGGYHRCGRGPCFVYTLARMGANGENPHSISFHETNEWDPCLLNDGRVLYTRWDYVDRHAVHYQQLWSARPDGGNVRIYYGNNTWNPAGIWEARAIPGSHRVMATAAPHHGMSAGSVILLDVTRGVDGQEPQTRLTPEVRFPEAESPLASGPNPAQPYDFDTAPSFYWNAPLKETWMVKEPTDEEMRWPGHCFKSPWPLSETLFIASYSYDQLVGEPGPNTPNMFGIYLCDAFGNKELLYRDPNISGLWARPLAPRARPPEIASSIDSARSEKDAGTFFLSNVMESWPYLPTNIPITHLRVMQVLLKTTPHADNPKVAAGLGAPGRQMLGTVPVEADGSAYFEVPAKTPVYFQALDAQGRAVQTMRSLVYLQPGECETCIGCHEHRMKKEPPRVQALAVKRPPSAIIPGPDGSRPFSYPRLVQPLLDRHCVTCHDGKEPRRPVLTGAPEGWASKSFNALMKHVSYSCWGQPGERDALSEPLRFGALASPLATLLAKGHGKVVLTGEEWVRLNTWMDANGAFYGTFEVVEQTRQLAGEVIAGPKE